MLLLSICFPKSAVSQYEFQKGMPWRYETLNAPFDFPIHKTEAELKEDREKATREQSPIYNLNPNTSTYQINKFNTALNRFRNPGNETALNNIVNKLKVIYTEGILQIPERMNPDDIQSVKIIENNIGKKVDLDKVYTLKKAYTTLSETINNSSLPNTVKENILSLNLNNYLQPNLEFDESKTGLEQLEHLKNISLTAGRCKKAT